MFLNSNIFGSFLYIKNNFFHSLFILFCFCIYNCFAYISGQSYCTSIKLENGNYFLVTNIGISIYDETLSNLIYFNRLNWNSDYSKFSIKKLTEEDGGYILLITSNYIYIIAPEGNYFLNRTINDNYYYGNSFLSIVPYNHLNIDYYFYYIYNNLRMIYFKKYIYNSSSNKVTSSIVKEQSYSELCPNHNNFVSCQNIKYNKKNSIICFLSNIHPSNLMMKIYDIESSLEIISSILWYSYNDFNSAKGIIRNNEKILMITKDLKWAGYDISEDKYTFHQGNIILINNCHISSYINISFINETEEFIAYFRGYCNINGNNYNYIFIYSFDENFTCSFFGTIRPFNLWDSHYCCSPFNSFNNTNYLSRFSIFFSSYTQKYVIIGSTQSSNDILIFILNKDINIKNFQEKKFNSTKFKFICENYKDINENCASNLSFNDSLIKNFNFIEKCSNEINIIESSCPNNINFNYTKFIKGCDLIFQIEGLCKMKEEEKKSSEETYQNLLNLIGDSSMNSKLDNLLYGDKEDIKLTDDEGNEYLITSTDNLRDNTKHTNTIDFGECETILKNNYSINDNESLIVLKIDKNNENKDSIKQVEYQVFHPKNKTLLNLSFCQDVKIDIFYQLSSDKFKNVDKLNQSSDFYNDPCYTNNANENGIDLTVSERRKNYIPSCETNCELVDYDIENNKTQCSCGVKSEVSLFNIITNPEEIYKQFSKISFSNIKIIKCFYLLFQIENLQYNIGNYIILCIIIIYRICFFIFIFKGYKSLKNEIKIFVNFIPNKNKKLSKNIMLTTDKEPKEIKKKKTKRGKKKSKNIHIKTIPQQKAKGKKINQL